MGCSRRFPAGHYPASLGTAFGVWLRDVITHSLWVCSCPQFPRLGREPTQFPSFHLALLKPTPHPSPQRQYNTAESALPLVKSVPKTGPPFPPHASPCFKYSYFKNWGFLNVNAKPWHTGCAGGLLVKMIRVSNREHSLLSTSWVPGVGPSVARVWSRFVPPTSPFH